MKLHLHNVTINRVRFFHLEKRQMGAMLECCAIPNSVGKRECKALLFLVTSVVGGLSEVTREQV